MISRDSLTTYIAELLHCSAFQDYAPNTLQVEGADNIASICTAVTASEEAITHAIGVKAQALLVHHGFFWRAEEPVLCGMKKKRIALLLQNQINLFAYHLPLDCHLELGNNAQLSKLLGIHSVKTHTVGNTEHLLWSGVLPKPISSAELSQHIKHKLHREPLIIEGSQKPIRTIAWCTGAAQDFIIDAYYLGVDAYLSGEVSERTYYQAKELGLYYFACGHHATERYGIQALGQHLSTHFNLDHQFIDSENPI